MARNRGLRLRSVGADRSWAPYQLTQGVNLDTSGIDRIIAVDYQGKSVRAEAGVRVRQLNYHPEQFSLALPCLPFLMFIRYWPMRTEADKLAPLVKLETAMRALFAKPHWGKHHRLPTTTYLKRAFKTWDRFEKQRAFDPEGMLHAFA